MFKGEKVHIRPLQEGDVVRRFEFAQDIEIYGLDCGVPSPVTLERVKSDFERLVKEEDPNKVLFAIEADGQYIGDIGLVGLSSPHGTAELGIQIGDRAYWGRGYGRDAVRVMLRYGFHFRGLRRIALTTHIKNERAIRCYRACGFVEEGRPRKAVWVEGEYVDLINMAILREEWQP